MGLLLFLVRRSPGYVLVAALASVIGGLSSTRIITLVNQALDSGPSSSHALRNFIAYCAVSLVATVISQSLIIRISASSLKSLRLTLSRQLLEAPYRQLEEIGPARLMPVLTSDIGNISVALTALPSVLTSVTVITACLVYLGTLSWVVLVALLVYAAAGIVLSALPTYGATRHLRLARQAQDRLFEQYRSLTEGAKELRLHRGRRDALYSAGLEESTEIFRKHGVRGGTTFELSSALGQSLLMTGIGLILFVAPRFAEMKPEVTSAYALTLLFMSTPVAYSFAMTKALVGAAISYERIRSMGLSLQLEEQPPPRPALPSWRRLELSDVVGTYRGRREDESFEVGPVNLSFAPGEVTFIVGGNGSGKSTLVKVLVGLYKPESGRVSLDGVDIDDASRDWLRQHFSVVFADFYLFSELRGIAAADLDAQAREYLDVLQLSHKVEVVGGELSTIALSQGQKKRLALLGAYLEDRPIYVFDEWAADQDPQFKEVFYTKLLPALKSRGKCVIAVTHDDRYFGGADRIVRMESGKVVQVIEQPQPATIP